MKTLTNEPFALDALAAPKSTTRPGLLEFFRYHGVWAPGVRLFRKVDFRAKAALISAVFAIPIAGLTWQFYSVGQQARNSTLLEAKGIDALVKADALLLVLRQQRMEFLSVATGKVDARSVQSSYEGFRDAAAEFAVAKGLKAVQEADTALQAASGVDDQTVQSMIDATASAAADIADVSGLSRDPSMDAFYLESVLDDLIPQAVESLSHAQALAAQYQVKGTPPEGPALQQLFAMTYWAAKHLMSVEVMLERVRSANPEAAARVDVKTAMERVWTYAGSANGLWFGDKFTGTSADLQAASVLAMNGMEGVRVSARSALTDVLRSRIARIDRQRYVVVAVLAATLCLGAYLFYAFFLVMRGGLEEVRRHLLAMTAGDLTTSPRPWGVDEAAALMLSLQDMQASLRNIVNRVRVSSGSIVHASNEIASASMDLSARTEQTASNLERSASSMAIIAATVNETAENVRQASISANTNSQVAARGGVVIGEVVNTMRAINVSSKRIGDIIGTIDSIAFQTNILALNAAVEAARAGEQGRGFAVVATEVRSLAKRSADAAKEIKHLITASLEQVDSGSRVVQGAGVTMQELVANANQINLLLSQIASAATEQSAGVSKVGATVGELDQMTQQNAALVEQTAAAASALKDQAASLATDVARFRLPA